MKNSNTFLVETLKSLTSIPSPSGRTEQIVVWTLELLQSWGYKPELTRRGAIKLKLPGKDSSRARALTAHLDTLGAMVRHLKENGRCALAPVGTWSSRFAEGARVTLHTDENEFRGTILPLLASGHAYNEKVDQQPVSWEQAELRIDEYCNSFQDLEKLGVQPGDFVSIDTGTEVLENGFIFSRHLDDKAGVAALLNALRLIQEEGSPLPCTTYLILTVREEIGDGGSAVLSSDVWELVTIDNGVQAGTQHSREFGVTLAMGDKTGPFDRRLVLHLDRLCKENQLSHQRDLFKHYRSDLAAAVEAGFDVRTALIAIGLDGSHGHERTHLDAIRTASELAHLYLLSPLLD